MFEGVVKQSTVQLREFVRLFFLTIIKYYKINILRSHNREIIIDKMTANIMKDQVYGAVMLLMMKKNENKLQALAGLMKKYENITLADLKISKYFQFDEHFRATFTLNYDTFLSNAADSTRPGGSSIYSNASPFQQAITELEYIRYIPEPTGKLTHIYNLN